MGGQTSSKLLNLAGVSFGIQLVVGSISALLQTEHYFDLTGSLTYWAMILAAYYQSPPEDTRSLVNTTMLLTWCTRLGAFLFYRVSKVGKDARFDKVKKQPVRFILFWQVQGLWCFLTAFSVIYLICSQNNDDSIDEPLNALDYLGWAGWVTGFLFECIADYQKMTFRENPKNNGKFIRSGLWSISQHPNYFGDILMWSSIWVSACQGVPAVQDMATMSISPLFVYVLLRYGSGVPFIDKETLKKYGKKGVLEYMAKTPMIFPFIGATSNIEYLTKKFSRYV